ncbi:hypothetical protein [Microseira sp. BLCC-F43]|uniref:hypothetical protein n=1 Tax=Microseira sp. BLCC-F43 TaxID=3153602 RepID=UPI0035B81995
MKTNYLIAGVGASLLKTELLSLGGALAQTSINKTLPALGNEQERIGKNCVLLWQNTQILENIAAKIGIQVSNHPFAADSDLLEVKQQLIWQTRSILIGIAKKLGVLIPSLPNAGGSDLVTQNHLLLLGNKLIFWAIASSLRINIPVAEPLHGSIIEQDYQLLLANQKILEAIARQLGATAAFKKN